MCKAIYTLGAKVYTDLQESRSSNVLIAEENSLQKDATRLKTKIEEVTMRREQLQNELEILCMQDMNLQYLNVMKTGHVVKTKGGSFYNEIVEESQHLFVDIKYMSEFICQLRSEAQLEEAWQRIDNSAKNLLNYVGDGDKGNPLFQVSIKRELYGAY